MDWTPLVTWVMAVSGSSYFKAVVYHLLPPNPRNSLVKQCSAMQLMGRGVKMRLYLAYDATEILESKLMQLAIFARLQHLISAMMMYVNTFLAWRNWRKKKRLTNFYVRYFLTSVWLGVMKDDGPCRAHFFFLIRPGTDYGTSPLMLSC